MKKFALRATVLLVILLLAFAGWLYYKINSFDVVKITNDLHMLQGVGGNVAVLKTDAGTVIVDSMTFKLQGQNIIKQAQELTGSPVVALINTHYHSDHTHGNPGFNKGVRVISTSKTLMHLKNTEPEGWQGDAAAFLPSEFVDNERDIKFGNKTVRLIHPGRGHTNGDLVVLFVEDKTIHTGDLFFAGYYPNIDLEGGGSVKDWPASLEKILSLPFTHIISGHGPVADAAELRQFEKFLTELGAYAAKAASQGLTKDQTIARADLKEDANLRPFTIPLILNLDRDFVIGRAWEEATGNFTAR